MPSVANNAAQRALNKKLSQVFRMRGLTVKPDAMQPLYDVLQGDEGWESTLQAVLAEVQLQDLKGGHVDATAIRAAVGALRTRTSHKPSLQLQTFDAFSMPAVKYDKQRRVLVAESAPPSLHALAPSKSAMYALRLAMIEQRVRRHEMFKPPVLANGVAPKEYLEITSIDALLGRSGVRVVLGMLAELEEGSFSLEDAHASIPIDLSSALVTEGLFTRHAIVLAEGEVLSSGVFRVRQLGLPPPESIQRSLASLGGLDMLRPAEQSASPSSVMAAPVAGRLSGAAAKAQQLAEQNAMLIVLSDVWLDSPSVRTQLATVFAGYEQVGASQVGSGRTAVPLASFFTFVLCGNFTSGALAASSAHGSQLRAAFRDLAQLLQQTPTLQKHAHFVLVPGPDDPSIGAPDVLPRAPLSRSSCADVLSALTNCELLSSPARLRLCGQHIVIHREELLVKARRACVLPPETTPSFDLNMHLLKSVIDQAHLCPLPPAEAAVYWQHEHALWMHPSPDVLIVADRQHQFQNTYEETLAFNPGAFASDLSWMVYRPGSREAEASSLEA
jgi:DNA polymerase epsilon subunit 2